MDLEIEVPQDRAIAEHHGRTAQGRRTVHPRMMRLFALALAASVLAVACAQPKATDPIERGAQVYREKNCASCHQVGSAGGTGGPPLTHVASVAESRKPGRGAEDYLLESTLEPGASRRPRP